MADLPPPRYYPALHPPALLPLSRYLPPLPQGMLSAWLAEHVRPGGWLLDPLGATPMLAIEAAREGYRVIVACNNPILSFMLEMLAAAPREGDYQSVIAEMAQAKRGEERLEPHVQALYLTECPRCGEKAPAQSFTWRRGENAPFSRQVRCPKCGEESESPTTPQDAERTGLPGSDALHRSRAIQRVVMSDDEYREDVEQAISAYLPRPLYILMTLINKLEGQGMPGAREKLLQALLISASDAGNTLWPASAGRTRPRQLTVPPAFRENNLWLSLEDAVKEWTGLHLAAPIPLTRWPELPPQTGGICLFRGRVKAITPLPSEIGPQAVVTVFPRPNQAFWTLSAVWAGWLWGREAALPLRNVLDRRRFDWNWHTTALYSVLSVLSRAVPGETPFFAILPELAPGFLSAAVTACETSGFSLQGIALPSEGDLAQITCAPSGALSRTLPVPLAPEDQEDELPEDQPPPPLADSFDPSIQSGIQTYLLERGEPAAYLPVYASAISALAHSRSFPESPARLSGDLFTRLQAALNRPFASRPFLRRYPASSRSAGEGETGDEERGWWWLAGPASLETTAAPLSDRVEIEIVRFIQKNPAFSYSLLENTILNQFRGLMTPSAELIRLCCESYAEPVSSQEGNWRMKPGESAAERRADLAEMRRLLEKLGAQMGFRVRAASETILLWQSSASQVAYFFALMASSLISRYVQPKETPGASDRTGPAEPEATRRKVIVLPGGKVRLMAYRLRHDPRLSEAAQGFTFLKFRQLRQIAARPDITCEAWENLLDQDPPTEEAEQIPLF